MLLSKVTFSQRVSQESVAQGRAELSGHVAADGCTSYNWTCGVSSQEQPVAVLLVVLRF